MHTYHPVDLLVCLGYLVAVVVVGFLSSRKQHDSVSGYFRASNQLPWYAIGFSIVGAGISSEQFVGEMGYAYKLGMPVANWEWLVLPALSALLWIFVPLYVRNNIATMPEYLERRFGGRARTLYAWLTIASYVLINFALVFYTAGFALEKIWGINRIAGVWLLALVTGVYTVYGDSARWPGRVRCNASCCWAAACMCSWRAWRRSVGISARCSAPGSARTCSRRQTTKCPGLPSSC